VGEREEGWVWFRALGVYTFSLGSYGRINRRTWIAYEECLVVVLCEALCVVHHTRAATYVTKDEDSD